MSVNDGPPEERFGDGALLRRYQSGVVELVMDRTEARNAISTAQATAISAATETIESDDSIRAVVLASADPKAFCVGADLKERNRFTDEELRAQRPVSRTVFGGVLRLPMPTIAAVHGHALGGGFELALSCDLLVADETAVLGLPEVSVGLVPGGGGTQLLPRRVGTSRALDLICTARHLSAAEADALGLLDRLVQAGRATETALCLAETIAANSPVGVRAAKRALRVGSTLDLPAGLEVEDAAWRETAFSPDRHEGIAAFNEKRKPAF